MMKSSMTMLVPAGGYVDQSVAQGFLGTMLPLNLPGGRVVEGLVTKVDVVSERGLDDDGRNTSFDRGLTVEVEWEEPNPTHGLLTLGVYDV